MKMSSKRCSFAVPDLMFGTEDAGDGQELSVPFVKIQSHGLWRWVGPSLRASYGTSVENPSVVVAAAVNGTSSLQGCDDRPGWKKWTVSVVNRLVFVYHGARTYSRCAPNLFTTAIDLLRNEKERVYAAQKLAGENFGIVRFVRFSSYSRHLSLIQQIVPHVCDKFRSIFRLMLK